MWIPQDAAEIQRAAAAGELEETASLDAKSELPPSSKNKDLAIDIAAMSTDGGVLLYGVAEDENGRPTIPKPITLVGQAERIDQIVASSIAEVPHIDVHEYPHQDDPSKGYLLVVVPASPRAPHQVIVGSDHRFYGRGSKGNRRLNEGDIARLYERRRAWQVDRSDVLAEVMASAPLPPNPDVGYLHMYARPVALEPDLLERALAQIGSGNVRKWMLGQVADGRLRDRYGPSLRSASWHRHGADMWSLSTHGQELREAEAERLLKDPTGFVELRINLEGQGQLFCGRATDRHSSLDTPLLIEVVIAGNAEAFLAVMGAVYSAAGYHGAVDLGLAVTGIEGARSEAVRNSIWTSGPVYPMDAYLRTERVAVAELEPPHEIARRLLRHLFEATTTVEGWDAFADG